MANESSYLLKPEIKSMFGERYTRQLIKKASLAQQSDHTVLSDIEKNIIDSLISTNRLRPTYLRSSTDRKINKTFREIQEYGPTNKRVKFKDTVEVSPIEEDLDTDKPLSLKDIKESDNTVVKQTELAYHSLADYLCSQTNAELEVLLDNITKTINADIAISNEQLIKAFNCLVKLDGTVTNDLFEEYESYFTYVNKIYLNKDKKDEWKDTRKDNLHFQAASLLKYSCIDKLMPLVRNFTKDQKQNVTKVLNNITNTRNASEISGELMAAGLYCDIIQLINKDILINNTSEKEGSIKLTRASEVCECLGYTQTSCQTDLLPKFDNDNCLHSENLYICGGNFFKPEIAIKNSIPKSLIAKIYKDTGYSGDEIKITTLDDVEIGCIYRMLINHLTENGLFRKEPANNNIFLSRVEEIIHCLRPLVILKKGIVNADSDFTEFCHTSDLIYEYFNCEKYIQGCEDLMMFLNRQVTNFNSSKDDYEYVKDSFVRCGVNNVNDITENNDLGIILPPNVAATAEIKIGIKETYTALVEYNKIVNYCNTNNIGLNNVNAIANVAAEAENTVKNKNMEQKIEELMNNFYDNIEPALRTHFTNDTTCNTFVNDFIQAANNCLKTNIKIRKYEEEIATNLEHYNQMTEDSNCYYQIFYDNKIEKIRDFYVHNKNKIAEHLNSNSKTKELFESFKKNMTLSSKNTKFNCHKFTINRLSNIDGSLYKKNTGRISRREDISYYWKQIQILCKKIEEEYGCGIENNVNNATVAANIEELYKYLT